MRTVHLAFTIFSLQISCDSEFARWKKASGVLNMENEAAEDLTIDINGMRQVRAMASFVAKRSTTGAYTYDYEYDAHTSLSQDLILSINVIRQRDGKIISKAEFPGGWYPGYNYNCTLDECTIHNPYLLSE